MQTIRMNDTGAAVEDVQQRLAEIGLLPAACVDGVFGEQTAQAVRAFCAQKGLPEIEEVDEKTWSVLVDASYSMGDRTLYLKAPYFHGNDVKQLQSALGALGFPCDSDGIFGVHTEAALRKFQLNLALYGDGIAGAQTFRAIHNLRHSWEGKPSLAAGAHLGFARAADVLEQNTVCLFGTSEFTRSVAGRMSNLSLATNPSSRIVSADSLLVTPDESMILVHVVLPGEKTQADTSTADNVRCAPVVQMDEDETDSQLALRLRGALQAAKKTSPHRITVQVPSESWEQANAGRAAQHYAITLLDALCSALSEN